MTATDLLQDILAGLPEPEPEPEPVGALPDSFWESRDTLSHIRQAAHSRQRSAVAVLHAVLARVAAGVPHTLQIPAIVGAPAPLCYFAVTLAPPGGGKSTANDIAARLVPLDPERVADQLPIGSGEGIVEALFGTVEEEDAKGKLRQVRRQVRHNAFVYVDEGEVLASLGQRSGATLLAVLRSAWSGKTIGNANASPERTRIVPAGQYTYGLVAGIQDSKAGPLLADADAGTPQRLGWASAVDPTVPDQPPSWPGQLRWAPPDPAALAGIADRENGWLRHTLTVDPRIVSEVRAADLARTRGAVRADEMEAHGHLLRLKIAGLLAVLDQRTHIAGTDWGASQTVKAASDATLRAAAAVVAADARRGEEATSTKLARRHVKAQSELLGWQTTEAARRIRDRVTRTPGVNRSDLRRDLRRWRDAFDDGLAHALSEGWVHEQVEASPTGERRELHPGQGNRP